MKQLFTLLLCAVVFSSCSSSAGKSSYADSLADSTLNSDSLPPDTEQDAAKPAEKTEKWEYSEEEDKMTSKKNYFAEIRSDNELNFEFPYNGGSRGSVLVRRKDGETDIVLSISKGQFNVNSDDNYVKVRFDEDKAQTFGVGKPSDGSYDLLFIHNSKKFLTQLKKSKKMIIQAEFYQSGLREMEFTTAGFKWDH